MRIEFHGLTFDTPQVTVHLWSPWRCSALEHRLFEVIGQVVQSEPESGADELRLVAGLRNPSVWRAFATVPRERFLGSGPWRVALPDLRLNATYTTTEDADPCWLYHNVSVALDESRDLVSGQPAGVARWIDELNIKPGERVLHLGSGAGYYTAVLAELAGPDGSVLAAADGAEVVLLDATTLTERRRM